MAIITISRGSYSKGKVISEKVAERLGYDCVSRDVLLEASDHFNIPEVKLVRALHDAPSILSRFTHGREKYVAFIRNAFLERVKKDDVVYHGLAGHFFLAGVTHVLKVRVLADMHDRVALEMQREGISKADALNLLQKDDDERRKWSLALYGIDTADARLYDLVLHIRKIEVDDAVETICRTAALPQFVTTEASEQALSDLLLSAQARVALGDKWPLARVGVEDGVVVVHVEAALRQEELVCREIDSLVRTVEGVRDVRISVLPATLI